MLAPPFYTVIRVGSTLVGRHFDGAIVVHLDYSSEWVRNSEWVKIRDWVETVAIPRRKHLNVPIFVCFDVRPEGWVALDEWLEHINIEIKAEAALAL